MRLEKYNTVKDYELMLKSVLMEYGRERKGHMDGKSPNCFIIIARGDSLDVTYARMCVALHRHFYEYHQKSFKVVIDLYPEISSSADGFTITTKFSHKENGYGR